MILLEALTFFMKSLNINPRDSDKDHIVIPKHLKHTHTTYANTHMHEKLKYWSRT